MTLQEKIQKKAEGYGKLAPVFLEGAKFVLENHEDKIPCNNKIGIIYIARDEGIYYDEYEYKKQGKLHLFYDTPLIHKDPKTNTLKFGCARCIAEIPSYMYPGIKEGDCYELYIYNSKTTKE